MLEQQYRRQFAFTNRVINSLEGVDLASLDDAAKTKWTKEYVLSLMGELKEILDCLNWKHHRTTDSGPRIDLVEEMIDVQKFLWGLMSIHGVSLEEFESEFDRKSDVVEQRWRQEHDLPRILQATNVALVDIDGVLADYPAYFIDWACREHPGMDKAAINKDKNPVLWERLKHEYRMAGAKRHAWVKSGAADGLNRLKTAGYSVLLLSNRPVKQYSRIVADTVEWLKSRHLPYDYIYWSQMEKSVDVLDRFPSVSVVFDDDPKTIDAVGQHGVRGFRIGSAAYPTLDTAVKEFLHA